MTLISDLQVQLGAALREQERQCGSRMMLDAARQKALHEVGYAHLVDALASMLIRQTYTAEELSCALHLARVKQAEHVMRACAMSGAPLLRQDQTV